MNKPVREVSVDEVLPAGNRGQLHTPDPLLALLARLMDTAFVIPGTNIRFGLDPIIGLIPGFGDTAGALVSTFLLLQSSRRGVPKIVLARMAMNVLINSAVGTLPVVGDAFSIYFKSNKKNYDLLQRHAGAARARTTTDWIFVGGLILAMLLIVGLIVVGSLALLGKLLGIGD